MVLGWIIAAFVMGLIGAACDFGFWKGFFASLFLSPLIAVILMLLFKK